MRWSDARIDSVVKVGGGLLAEPAAFDAVLAILGEAARSRRILIVPGGGPFADAVRLVDQRLGLHETTAHWMAVLAMDQYAHLLAERLGRASVVSEPRDVCVAIAGDRVPVLAPSRWLVDVDPLPHSWDVTSDSIAAWVAGQLRARQLILVKPAGAGVRENAVDPYFANALPPGISAAIIAADRTDSLRSALSKV